MSNLPRIQDIIITHEADALVGLDCLCGRLDNTTGTTMKATTRCMDCSFSTPTCSECFLDTHKAQFTHWAEVWNNDVGCFVRCDISRLRPFGGYVINLGHGGWPCPKADYSADVLFHIVASNGVHNTKLRFCGCHARVDRAEQLLNHRLFPSTMNRPQMAFTFQLLEQFNLLNVEAKISAHDFIGYIRRLSDNAFTHRVTVRLLLKQCLHMCELTIIL